MYITYQSQILAHDTSLARFENLPIGHNYTVSGSYFNGDGVETANVSGDTVFQGVSSESIAPSSTKFIISAGIDFDINSNAPVSGTFKIYDSNQRLIREINFNNAAGHSTVHWDGRDGNGNKVFSDIFWVKSNTDHFGRQTMNVAGVR